MDQDLTELALSGAQAIVKLMATDAWEGAKKLIARIFPPRSDSAPQEILQDLDSSRLKLTAGSSPDPATQEYAEDRLEALLRLRLLEDPTVASSISEILEFARTRNAILSDGAAGIVMNADARDKARIYQQGSGIQRNG
jgi:hypothetical protein